MGEILIIAAIGVGALALLNAGKLKSLGTAALAKVGGAATAHGWEDADLVEAIKRAALCHNEEKRTEKLKRLHDAWAVVREGDDPVIKQFGSSWVRLYDPDPTPEASE